MSVIVSRSHLVEVLGLAAVEDAAGCSAPGRIAAVRALEVVEAQEGLKFGIERLDDGVAAVAEGDPVVEMEDRPLEALEEGVEVGTARRDPVVVAVAQATLNGRPNSGPLSAVAVARRRPARRIAGRTSTTRKRAMTAAVLGPVITRAMPKLGPPSTVR